MTNERIKVAGMSCQHCVSTIETGVGALNGVENVTVNLETGDVAVSFDQTKVTLMQITETIEDKGYDLV